MLPRRLLLPACLLAVLLLGALPAAASAVNVYAAASLRDVFRRIDGRPAFNFLGSNQLQLQIMRGAPADVFAAASPREPAALFRERRCDRPRTFATNQLVLIVPRANPARIRSVGDLSRGDAKRLVVGSPSVPVGSYTRRLLEKLRLTAILRRNTVSEEANVAGVVSKVALGSADAGFVYVTDARIARGRVSALRLPTYAQPPIRYDLCIVRRRGADTRGAADFVRRVLTPRGRQLLRAGGFGVPAG
jgi:molybdate transport system substrate-binding protein